MPQRKFALERGGPRRLRVKWGWGSSGVKVFLDDMEVPPAGPHQGDYRLPDGTWVHVDVDAQQSSVDVLRDGQFLPGSRFDPFQQLAVTYVILLGLGVLHAVLAWLPIDSVLPPDIHIPLRSVSLGLAFGYAFLGFAVSKRSKPAMFAAISLFTVEAVCIGFVGLAFAGRKLIIGALLATAAGLIQGLDALREIEISEQPPA
jgi:hypothetical protein